METAQGVAIHCQNTSHVTGDEDDNSVRTTYVASFQLEQRQVHFSSVSPLSVSDGDRMVVAGRSWRAALRADAVRNVTTGLTTHTGVAVWILVALFVLAAGLMFAWVATQFVGKHGGWIYLPFAAAAVYALWRGVQTGRALRFVRSVAP